VLRVPLAIKVKQVLRVKEALMVILVFKGK
jgi:hypothetical protein